jgi:hypothetical protein
MGFVQFLEGTAIISLNSINQLIFVRERCCFFGVVGTESLYIYMSFSFKGLIPCLISRRGYLTWVRVSMKMGVMENKCLSHTFVQQALLSKIYALNFFPLVCAWYKLPYSLV